MLQCCGRTWGEQAFLIKCDCFSHLMEIGYYKEDNTMKGYVQFFGILYTKYKFPDVFFDDQREFEDFLECVQNMLDYKTPSKHIFYSYGIIKNKKKVLGRLEVEFDNYGYLNFCFYKREKPRNNERVVWDICVRDTAVWNQIYSRCNEILYSLQEEVEVNE